MTRPLLMGQSLPWLAGIVLVLAFACWYLFWPSSSNPDAEQLAFGPGSGYSAEQPAAAPAPSLSLPEPVQTGGLSVPAASVSVNDAGGSVPEDVVKLIREGREFEAANREAITRLSDTVRAQSKALAGLQQRLDGLATENSRLAGQLTVVAARPASSGTARATTGNTGRRSALSGMRLEGLQDGMAWVSWQGRTWAVQPGDSLGTVTVQDVNVAERSITTSAGVLR
nr:conjugal transfer protein TraP [Erwinia rhapontici]